MDRLLASWFYIEVDEQDNAQRISLKVDKDGDGNALFYICKYCKEKLAGGTVPPTCILNECEMARQPATLKYMKEVEVSPLARKTTQGG